VIADSCAGSADMALPVITARLPIKHNSSSTN